MLNHNSCPGTKRLLFPEEHPSPRKLFGEKKFLLQEKGILCFRGFFSVTFAASTNGNTPHIKKKRKIRSSPLMEKDHKFV